MTGQHAHRFALLDHHHGIAFTQRLGRIADEFARRGGQPRLSGLVAVQYLDAERLDEIMGELATEDGCHVMNAHVHVLEKSGRKTMNAEEQAFRRAADPHGLMNPGKILSLG